ncbi:MAG: type IV pilus twitching motility protein PilT [Planctomycetes bacterium]|nr:type IV pilus twitching motility protein PilT [Planctomycetota bacterium]
MTIDQLLHEMVKHRASDLHLRAGTLPGFRIDGNLVPQERYDALTPELTKTLAHSLMSEEQRKRFEHELEMDFSHAVPGLSRFRVNVMVQRGSVAMVLRQIPDRIPTAADLHLPQICLELALKPRGLVLVTGPTGSGKSTTLAAMIDHYNSNESGHILTMEDPLEFIHPDKKCYVTQRQVGLDTRSFQEALRRALRQDPDVILIGEMRDLETISMAITAAETGHLVFGTLHTTTAISTVDRIIDVFPHEAQQQVRVQLGSTLQGVISQALLPKVGGGRVAAREILIATDGVRSLVREGKTAQIVNLMQTGAKSGMSTLENELANLVNKGLVALDDALSFANRPEDVMRLVKDTPQRAAAAEAGMASMAAMGGGRGAAAGVGAAVGGGTGLGAGTMLGTGSRPAPSPMARPRPS